MPEKLNMSVKLFRELALRWDERGGGFRVRSIVVPFTSLDVCFALGLRIVGEKVVFDEVGDSHTKGLFGGAKVTTASVYEKLREVDSDEEVDDFCSLSRTSGRLSEAKNAHQIHLTGCTSVLQIWAMDHLTLQAEKRNVGVNCFPRFLILGNCGIRGRQISCAFQKNQVVCELAATNEEVQHEVVKEALRRAGSGFAHWRQTVYDIESLHVEHEELLAKNKDLEKMISTLEVEYLH
ncbi:hypothetical protein SESBI_05672 [Sesbania bispinosa]|nr:hypothetical protein SESBI_05672 [Sesbania bispinosa]